MSPGSFALQHDMAGPREAGAAIEGRRLETLIGQTVCVTGALGCLGSALVSALQSTGATVRALVRPGAAPIDWGRPEVETVGVDLSDSGRLAAAVGGAAVTIHLAAMVHVDERRYDWAAFHEANVAATARLYAAARSAGVRRFVFVSSVTAIGGDGGGGAPLTEEAPCEPETLYGRSKLAAEVALLELSGGAGTDLVIIRPSMLFGERDRGNFARMLRAISRGRFALPDGGTARKSVCYADNAAQALILAAVAPRASGRLYLLSDEPAPTVRELAEHVRDSLWQVTGHRPRLPVFPTTALRAAAVANGVLSPFGFPQLMSVGQLHKLTHDAVVDSHRIRTELGYEPAVPLDEAIRRTVQWFHSTGSL
jgi:UDP-glucose 4-epimerase